MDTQLTVKLETKCWKCGNTLKFVQTGNIIYIEPCTKCTKDK